MIKKNYITLLALIPFGFLFGCNWDDCRDDYPKTLAGSISKTFNSRMDIYLDQELIEERRCTIDIQQRSKTEVSFRLNSGTDSFYLDKVTVLGTPYDTRIEHRENQQNKVRINGKLLENGTVKVTGWIREPFLSTVFSRCDPYIMRHEWELEINVWDDYDYYTLQVYGNYDDY